MKIIKFIFLIIPFALLFSCSQKTSKQVVANPTVETANCSDTFGTIVFVNTKGVEQKVSILMASSVMEGKVLVNTYTKIKSNPVKVGDSVTYKLSVKRKYMFDVYGPVSTNVDGQGVIKEKKFVLKGCEYIREIL